MSPQNLTPHTMHSTTPNPSIMETPSATTSNASATTAMLSQDNEHNTQNSLMSSSELQSPNEAIMAVDTKTTSNAIAIAPSDDTRQVKDELYANTSALQSTVDDKPSPLQASSPSSAYVPSSAPRATDDAQTALVSLSQVTTKDKFKPACNAIMQFFQSQPGLDAQFGQTLLSTLNHLPQFPQNQITLQDSFKAARADAQMQSETIMNLEMKNRTLKSSSMHQGARTFTLFKKLPVEIKLIIWKFAVWVPKVVAVTGGEKFTKTKDPGFSFHAITRAWDILTVCKEAYGAASKVQMPLMKRFRDGREIIYTNQLAHTVWWIDSDQAYDELHDEVGALSCSVRGDLEFMESHDITEADIEWKGKPMIYSLAVQSERWHHTFNHNLYLTLRSLKPKIDDLMTELDGLGTEEIILIVGGTNAQSSEEIVFIESQGTPFELLPFDFFSHDSHGELTRNIIFKSGKSSGRFKEELRGATWTDLENETMIHIRGLQEQRALDRENAAKSGISLDYLDNMDGIAMLMHHPELLRLIDLSY